MPLLQATFECEVLTPMFLSGVDQRACELRAPSLRGALRFWYRALLGGQGIVNLDELRRREAEVFGSTDAGSPVSVRVQQPSDLARHLGHPRDLPDWNAEDPDHPRMGSPTRYLWYSADLNPNERHWIPPGTPFRVVLQTMATGRRAEAQRHALEQALEAFWLAAHLGSLGSRARRAAGGFSARLSEQRGEFSVPPFDGEGRFDPGTAAGHLEQLLPTPQGGRPDWSVLGAESGVWLAGFDAAGWEDAVWEAGKALRGFRLRLGLEDGPAANPAPDGFPDDYSVMREAVAYNAPPRGAVGRVSFGLPLTFRFGSERGKKPKTLQPEGRGLDRRASPLWIRIARLPSGRYDAVLTHLGGRLLPGGVEARGPGRAAPAPGESLIPHFVRSIETHRPLFPAT